jgi:hypothetical protein
VNLKDIYWLAGLVEGEGCFSNGSGTPSLVIQMTDEDVIEKVASMFKKKHTEQPQRNVNWKKVHTIGVYGSDAIQWMFTLYSLMGRRRKEKIKEIVEVWKKQLTYGLGNTFGCGHPKTPDNTYYKGRVKACKICVLVRSKNWQDKNYPRIKEKRKEKREANG